MADEYVEAVLEVVEHIPPGHVLSYGDIAGIVGRGGPRGVGRVMARCAGDVPWWRVVHADGTPPCQGGEALAMLAAEGVVIVRGRVDMRAARWDGRRP